LNQRPALALEAEAVAIAHALADAGIEHALIGGLAVLIRGRPRLTFDIDFLVAVEQRDNFVAQLRSRGFAPFHEAPAFGNYAGEGGLRVDALYARSELGHAMLQRANSEPLHGTSIKVVAAEDLIALKLQALANDPNRFRDWADIQGLLALGRETLDLVRVREYFGIFGFHEELDKLLANL
jgi:hypothetical protein